MGTKGVLTRQKSAPQLRRPSLTEPTNPSPSVFRAVGSTLDGSTSSVSSAPHGLNTSMMDAEKRAPSVRSPEGVKFRSAALRPGRTYTEGAVPPAPSNGVNSSWNEGSESTEAGCQSNDLLREMRRLRLQMGELERIAGHREKAPKPREQEFTSTSKKHNGEHLDLRSVIGLSAGNGMEAQGAPANSKSNGKTADRRSAPLLALPADDTSAAWPDTRGGLAQAPAHGRTSMTDSERSERSGSEPALTDLPGWAYRPHPSDPVDVAVAALVNKRGRYRSWRALLCRLSQGLYLCGTRRIHLSVDKLHSCIKASEDGGRTWADLEEIMQGAESSQHALLERARDAAGLAV